MPGENKEKKPIGIFIALDDFRKQLNAWKQSQPERFPVRPWEKPLMGERELMGIGVFYHYPGYKCFQYY